MPQSTYHPQHYLLAHDVCDHLLQDRQIHFQMEAENMDRPEAVKHFKERQALLIVKQMLLDAGDRALESL